MIKKTWIPWIHSLSATLFLSLTGIFIAALNQSYSMAPLEVAFWRNLLVTLFFMLLLIKRKEWKKISHWGFFLIFGIVQCCFNLLWTYSVFLNGAAVSTLLVYSSVIFTPFLEAIFFKKKLSPGLIPVLILCMGGCYLISGTTLGDMEGKSWIALAVGLGSGLGYGIYTIIGKGALNRGYKAQQSLFHSFKIATLCMFLLMVFQGDFLPTVGYPQPMVWLLLLGLALGPTFLGFLFYQKSLERLSCTTVHLVLSLEPLLTAFFAWVLLKEPLNSRQLFGALFIFGSIILWGFLDRRPGSRVKARNAA